MAERARAPHTDKFGNRSPNSQVQGEDSGFDSMDASSEKSPNQASQSPPTRKERLDMPRSTSPASVQRIIGVLDAPPPSDELLERLSLATDRPRYDPAPPDLDDMGDIEAQLAKMHADHVNGDDAPRRPPESEPPRSDTKDAIEREPTPILADEAAEILSLKHEIARIAESHEALNLKMETPPEISPPKQESESEPPPRIDGKDLNDEVSTPKEDLCKKEDLKLDASSENKEKGERDDFDPLPSRVLPPLYTYSNPEKTNSTEVLDRLEEKIAENGETKDYDDHAKEKIEPKSERLPLKADFPDKSLLEQLLIEIPTPEYVGKRPESPSPSAAERVARSSVRTRSSSKMNSPADGPRTPGPSPGADGDSPAGHNRNCLRGGSADKNAKTPAPTRPAPAAKRRRRESESSGASAVSCEDGASPAGRPKKKPRRPDGQRPAGAPADLALADRKQKKDSDSDSDEPLICKVRGKGGKGVKTTLLKTALGAGGVSTRRSVRHGQAPPPPAAAPAPASTPAPATAPASASAPAATPPRRKTRSAGTYIFIKVFAFVYLDNIYQNKTIHCTYILITVNLYYFPSYCIYTRGCV